ncbi:MAG: zinc-ribbon domain-containing protein [Marinilabiliaceae bacterium]
MICPKCHSENADDAKFCTHCGRLLETSSAGSLSSTLVSIWVIIFIATFAIRFIIERVDSCWYQNDSPYMIFWYLTCLVSNLSNILIPFAIKNKVLRIISLVLVSGISLYWAFNNLSACF